MKVESVINALLSHGITKKEAVKQLESLIVNGCNCKPDVNVKRFSKPKIEEVEQYCQLRGNNINPQAFIDFYESKNWMIGKNKMKDWKASIRTWENKNKDGEQKIGRQSINTFAGNSKGW